MLHRQTHIKTKLIGAFRDYAKAPTDRQTEGHEEGNRPFTRDYAIAVVSKHPPLRGHGPKKSRSTIMNYSVCAKYEYKTTRWKSRASKTAISGHSKSRVYSTALTKAKWRVERLVV